MIDLLTTTLVRGYGPSPRILRAKFAGTATTSSTVPLTLIEQFGIKTIFQTATGVFAVTLQNKYAEFAPFVWVTGDSTVIHDTPCDAPSFTAGTFGFSHFQSATRGAATAPATAGGGNSPAVTFNVIVIARGTL